MINKEIKDYCVACWQPMTINGRRYVAQGNYCSNCCARITREISSPNSKRHISPQESQRRLEERRVKYGMH